VPGSQRGQLGWKPTTEHITLHSKGNALLTEKLYILYILIEKEKQ